jgi:hypothetical protein
LQLFPTFKSLFGRKRELLRWSFGHHLAVTKN